MQNPVFNSVTQKHVDVLSRLVLLGYSSDFGVPNRDLGALYPDFEYVCGLAGAERAEFLRLADTHHVSMRALQVVKQLAITDGREAVCDWCEQTLNHEKLRIDRAVQSLAAICDALRTDGTEVAVIKSLDHWPDLGSDLDLFTSAEPANVIRIFRVKFAGTLEPRSWGDRLANKWNFNVPGLPELVEVHVRYLGQTGEHIDMARRVIERSVSKSVNEYTFEVPAPEERVLISTLQRMYRHFYFRLCDMADFARLLQGNSIDFVELKNAANIGGIWRGVATFLLLVADYGESYGATVGIPDNVRAAAYSQQIKVSLGGDFLRVPKAPAASLYGSQLLNAVRRVDMRAMFRLPLLPPLAVSALAAYRITGSDKGVW